MFQKQKNYPIVFLPGVFDSILYFDKELTKQAWPVRGMGPIIDLIHSGGIEKLEHQYAAAQLYVRPPVNNNTAVEKCYGVSNKWEQLTKALQAAFPERDVWFFSYDFRQLSTTNMVHLNAFLKSIEGAVDVVCHSYGNNLLASYLTHYGSKKVHRAICLAPPFLGSAEVFLVPAGSSFMPCMGELAPRPSLNKDFPVYLKRSEEANPEPVDKTVYNEILVKFFGSGSIPVDYQAIFKHPETYFGIGTDRLTPASTTFTLDDLGMPYVSDFSLSFQGDGTVLRQSSNPISNLEKRTTYFPNLGHSNFYRTPAVWYWTMMQINSGDAPMRRPEIQKEAYIKFIIDGASDVRIRKPFSVREIVSSQDPASILSETLVIGPQRNITLAMIEHQDCVLDVYSFRKKEKLKVTIEFYNNNNECTSERREEVEGRYIRYTVSADGTVSQPFVIDIPPILPQDSSSLATDLKKAVSELRESHRKESLERQTEGENEEQKSVRKFFSSRKDLKDDQ